MFKKETSHSHVAYRSYNNNIYSFHTGHTQTVVQGESPMFDPPIHADLTPMQTLSPINFMDLFLKLNFLDHISSSQLQLKTKRSNNHRAVPGYMELIKARHAPRRHGEWTYMRRRWYHRDMRDSHGNTYTARAVILFWLHSEHFVDKD